MEPKLPLSASSNGLASVYDRMTPDDAECLKRRLQRLSSASARKDRRDDALRDLVAILGIEKQSRAARIVAGLLTTYLEERWQATEHLVDLPAGTSRNNILLHTVLRWNNGRPLGWRQIVNIMDACRGG